MNGVSTCSSATADSWSAQVQGCLGRLQPITKACGGE